MQQLTLPRQRVSRAFRVGATDRDGQTRQLIYLYLALLLFEGALRKWVMPGLSSPLLLVRDPVALLIIFSHGYVGRAVFNAYTLPMLIISVLSLIATVVVGHGNAMVGLFGFRSLVLHFFVIFIIGQVLDRSDLYRIGRWLLILLIPSTILLALQFYSPQSAWVNRGIGGDLAGAGFSGAMGYQRPSGLFSFTNGNTLFYGLVTAFAGYFIIDRKRCPNWLLIAAMACLIVALPISISRSYIVRFALTLLFLLVVVIRSGRKMGAILAPLAFGVIIVLILGQLEFFQTAVEVISVRFEATEANDNGLSESFSERVLGAMFNAFSTQDGKPPLPFFGYGLGLGTNVGAILMGRGGEFLVAEGEWLRITGEMGLAFGGLVLLLRVVLGLQLFIRSLAELGRNNPLPFMLLSFSLSMAILGGWSQPTTLGFGVVAIGFTIAAFNPEREGKTSV